MPTDQIYVLEAVVNKIELEPNLSIKDKNALILNFKFSQRVNFDIETQSFSPPEEESCSDGRIIDVNYGKTFLFVAKPSDLRQLLLIEPYQITLLYGNKMIGTTVVPWKKEFAEMVKFFETLGIVKSTTVEDWFELKNDQGIKAARVQMFIRMSCYGTNVQTMYQIRKGEGTKQEYLFRQWNMSKTFKIERHRDERYQPLVAPLYSAILEPKSAGESLVNMRENASLTQLFDREMVTPKLSSYQGPDDGNGGINLDFGQDYDIVSICFRPSENKFFDILNILSANVKTHEKGTCVTFQKSKAGRVESFIKSVGGSAKQNLNVVEDDDEDTMLHTTAEEINKKLCGNKDCPAIKKFKEYGIGPLATGSNLGTLYDYVEPHVTYGMSHMYGTMSNYGPYGVFARPKQEELPFVPAEPVKPCKIRKIQNTNSPKSCKKQKKKKPQWHSQSCPLCPERLRGGSDDFRRQSTQSEDRSSKSTEDDVMLMPKSPMMECKSVMDQFDNILAEYKKALGPCGHATCPYAQTIAEDTCKKACDQPVLPPDQSSSMSCNDVPCDLEECPYAGDPKKKRYPAGCGNPKCAYTKYKLGLVDDDAELELQFLPPALGGNCGSPHCKYPLAPPLPPIHWDCPDPLPKGPCQNLNCPFQPPRLKKFKTKKQLKTGPCGSPMCPYALPQPCGVPTCPFAMRPCPMSQVQNQKPKERKCPPSREENLCENPDCPFAESNAGKGIIDVVDDPKFKGEFQDCENPDCPYKKKDRKKKSKNKQKESPCGNPYCPFSKPTKKDKKKKRKRECPASEETSICSNPDCDFNQEKEEQDKNNACGNPGCPFNKPEKEGKKKKKNKDKRGSEDISVCSDPDCSFNKKKDRNRCVESSSDTISICSDPECPYAELKKLQKKKNGKGDAGDTSCDKLDDDSLCSNPECPEKLTRIQDDTDVCTQPGCPYSATPPKSSVCVDPRCPYLKPLPSCGVPNCPYEPIPVRFFCKNPNCPSHKVDFSRKIDRSKLGFATDTLNENQKQLSQGLVGVDNTAAMLQTTTVCEDTTVCEPSQDCENPDCEMKEDKLQNDQQVALIQPKKKGKRKNKGKFVYSIGDTYPGTKLGHKECVMPVFNVPPHMGWLWNIFTPILRLKPRRGWRPGALTRTIAARIRAHRQAKGLGHLKLPNFKVDGTQYDEDGDPKVVPKPTLQIQKKDGAYWITMNPLKDPFSLVENEDPYMECTPMTFKITKNKKADDDYCYCDGDGSPENLSTSTSDSELDIEFTPPAGIIHPERFKKKPNIVCCDTQYDPKDFEVPKKETDKKGKGKGKDKKGGKGGKGGKKGGKKKK